MVDAGVPLDLPQDRARVKGEWLDLATAEWSHYGVDLLPKSKSMRKFETIVAEWDTQEMEDGDLDSRDEQSGTGKQNKIRIRMIQDSPSKRQAQLFLMMRQIHR